MFLDLLNKKEQENFLELADIASKVDGIVEEREKKAFEWYRKETDLEAYQVQGKQQSELVSFFDMSTKRVKKIVIMELAGMLYADLDIVDEENKWLEEIGASWGFRSSEIRRMVRWVMDFTDLLVEGYEIIDRKERIG